VTAAAVAFCCVVALALVQGYGARAFATTVASDAINAALPFLGLLLLARFAEKRMPENARLITRLHAAGQGLVAGMSFGWLWFEPHAFLTSLTGGSLEAMAWLSVMGVIGGFLLALAAERASAPLVFREVGLGATVLLLLGGGHAYRVFDHVEAGVRVTAAAAITAAVAALGMLAYLALRRRERLAAAIPSLAPAAACLALVAASMQGGPAERSSRESILVVLVDTLRADIADGGMPGIPPPMPELARLAEQGVRFTQAVSPAPWTLPASVSLLSGWNPHRHGFGASVSQWDVTRGDPGALYLAGTLRDAGYLSAAFVHNPYLRPYFGFGRDFYLLRPYHGRAFDGVALALGWLSDRSNDASFTLLHLMDPHWPYDAPPGFGEPPQACAACDSIMSAQYGATSFFEKAELRQRYAAEVRFTDAMIGQLYDTLAAGNTLDDTWIVVTADHGEEFWDHGGFLHGHTLYDELLRVPLVVVPPRSRTDIARGRRIADQVRLEDVAATVLEIAGLDAGLALDGRSLMPLLLGKSETAPRVGISGYVKSVDDFSYAVRRPPWKAIVREGHPANFLFWLDRDPAEKRNFMTPANQSAANRKFVDAAFSYLRSFPGSFGLETERSTPKSSARTPDADTHRKLRSLGYAD
jgi:arylsulfatase A-like enzyme